MVEGISIATQVLLTRYDKDRLDGSSERTVRKTNFIIQRAFQAGLQVSTVLSFAIYLFRYPLVNVLTNNQEIKDHAINSIPVFVLSQSKWLDFSLLP